MDSKFIRGAAACALVTALSFLVPSEGQAQQRSGVEIWEANCGRCHMLQPTNKYYPKDWRSVGAHMTITARLTSAQAEAVIAFLISGARTDATAALTSPRTTRPTASVNAGLSEEQIARLATYLSSRSSAPTSSVTMK